MAKNQKVKDLHLLLLIFGICLVFFFKFLINPHILTHKDNDLGRNYIPIYTFIHDSFFSYKSLPLWRSEQMAGETFVGNPLSALFYPVNIIFLILSVDLGSVFYILVHFLLSAIFTFYLAKSFGIKKEAAFAAGLFYAFSVKGLLHVAAGHITMIAAFSFFPLALLSLRKILLYEMKKMTINGKFIWIVSCAVSLTFIYVSYPTIFYYSLIFLIAYFIYFCIFNLRLFQKNHFSVSPKLFLAMVLTAVFWFGYSAIAILPHLEFAAVSTRSSLRLEDVAIPIWNKEKLFSSLFFPYFNLSDFDHESLLYLSLVVIAFSILGFLKLSLGKKFFLGIGLFVSILFVAGTSTPFFETIYNYLPFIGYLRVTTRLWFVVVLVASLLASLYLSRVKSSKLVYLIILIFLVEVFYIWNKKLEQVPSLSFEDENLYEYLSRDSDVFRVYCTTYCFNPQMLSKYKIEILNGETPIQDARTVEFLERAGGYRFVKFTVIFPPYQAWQVEDKPKPDAFLMGLANVKYIASTYKIESSYFEFVGKFDDIFLYFNNLYKPRAYFEGSSEKVDISNLSPNNIRMSFDKSEQPRVLIYSESYNSGWEVFSDFKKYKVESRPYIFRQIIVPAHSESVELKFLPQSFVIGRTVTLFMIAFTLLSFFYTKFKKNV